MNEMVPTTIFTLHSWNSTDNGSTIENEEWLAFLQKNMEELMAGQLDCLKNTNLVSVVIAPLRNHSASPKVLEHVANMLALPFVVSGPSERETKNIEEVYLEAKVLPNLVYAFKVITRKKSESRESTPGALTENEMQYQAVSELSADELQALEAICLLACYLVHSNEDFLLQFCDAVAILNAVPIVQQFLMLGRRKLRVVTDILAILNLILMQSPENADLVEQIVLGSPTSDENILDLGTLLSHPSPIVKFRTCELIRQLASSKQNTQLSTLSSKLEQNLMSLLSDSSISVHMAAEEVLQNLKKLTIKKA